MITCYFFRYHLQAFRHLYVLAAEPRVLVPCEVDTKKACYVPLEVTLKVGNQLFFRVRRGSLFQLYCCNLFARIRVTLVQWKGNRFPFSRPLDKCKATSGSKIGIDVLVIVSNCWFTKVESIFVSLAGNSVLPRGQFKNDGALHSSRTSAYKKGKRIDKN